MSAPMIGITSQAQQKNRHSVSIKEEIEMKLANLTIKVNMAASKVLGGNTPAKLLGGIALSAILAAVVVLPSTPAYGAEPVRPMTKESRISHEQLMDDLGEWGRVTGKAVIPTNEQLVDDLGEYGRVANSAVIPSHDQLMDDLGEFGRVTNTTVIPSHDQLMDDLGEWGQ